MNDYDRGYRDGYRMAATGKADLPGPTQEDERKALVARLRDLRAEFVSGEWDEDRGAAWVGAAGCAIDEAVALIEKLAAEKVELALEIISAQRTGR